MLLQGARVTCLMNHQRGDTSLSASEGESERNFRSPESRTSTRLLRERSFPSNGKQKDLVKKQRRQNQNAKILLSQYRQNQNAKILLSQYRQNQNAKILQSQYRQNQNAKILLVNIAKIKTPKYCQVNIAKIKIKTPKYCQVNIAKTKRQNIMNAKTE